MGKTGWYFVAIVAAYYFYTKSPAQQLATLQQQAAADAANGVVQAVNIGTSLLIPTQPVAYQIPTVTFAAGLGGN